MLAALGERDDAEICRDRDGQPEPDADLRDTETVPLKESHTQDVAMGWIVVAPLGLRIGEAGRAGGEGGGGGGAVAGIPHRPHHRRRHRQN